MTGRVAGQDNAAPQPETQEVLLAMAALHARRTPLAAGVALPALGVAATLPGPSAVAWLVLVAAYLATMLAVLARWQGGSIEDRLAQVGFWRAALLAVGVGMGLVAGGGALIGFAHWPQVGRVAWSMACIVPFTYVSMVTYQRQLAYPATQSPLLMLAWALWGGELAAEMMILTFLYQPIYIVNGWGRLGYKRSHLHLSLRQEALAARLAQRNEALERANRSKTGLLAAASHDLRQPVHALGVLSELMDERDPNGVDKRMPTVRCAVNALGEMLTQLLDFNRLELGLYVVRPQPVAVDALLREVHATIAAQAEARGLALTLASQPLVARTDALLLRRMLFNLATNALKFTREGQVAMSLALVRGEVVLTVADSGIGIERARLTDVFQEYARLPGRLEGEEGEEGLGLGLSIVAKGAALLGHRVAVGSELGRGTCFTVTLGVPLPASALQPAPAIDTAALPAAIVAVLENDPLVLQGLADTLRVWGLRPVSAGALAQLRAQLPADAAPALLLSDLHLGGTTDGLGAIRQLREVWGRPGLPAILVTGDLDSGLHLRAREAGAWLAHKPLRPARLRELVTRALADGTV